MIGDTGLNQTQTAKWLQVDQSRISQLLNRQLVHFSTDTLLDLLARARVRVDVVFDQRDKSSDADSQSTSDEILPRTGAR
jgi:predicted XRE-type DNA-binding protein